MTRILVTGAGGAAAVSFMRAVAGPDVTLFAADIDPHAVGLYLVPEEHRVLLPRAEDPSFGVALMTAATRLDVDVVVPTVDAELAITSALTAAFRVLKIAVLVAPEAALVSCLDKAKLMAAAQGIVPVPAWEVVDADFIPERWELPVVVKPRVGAGGRGVRVIEHKEDWADVPRDGSLLLQEWLPGEEYSVDVLCSREGIVLAAVPRLRMKVDSGVAVASRTVRDPELQGIASALVEHLGLSFVSNVQLRRDRNGVPKLLEINPRFPGTMALTVHSGVNMPVLAVDDLLGRNPQAPAPFVECAMVRHWEEIYLPVSAFETVTEAVA
ncbi:MAG: carbamoyl-phosphate synthase large subunit [Myxococcota bacterium]|jgi:carbamoyl-phosphate synthase large subunit